MTGHVHRGVPPKHCVRPLFLQGDDGIVLESSSSANIPSERLDGCGGCFRRLRVREGCFVFEHREDLIV